MNPLPCALHGWREFEAIESKMPIGSIIIIDDNSDDNTVELIRESNDGKITLLQNKDKDRNECREFQKCLDVAIDFCCTIMYI
jgi:hypothetical protein